MFKRINRYVDRNRFRLLLIFTLVFLVVPSYFKDWILYDVITFLSLTFVFMQSLFVITDRDKKPHLLIIMIFFLVLVITWFQLLFEENPIVDTIRFFLYFTFFALTIASLVRFISRAKKIDKDVVTVSIVIYLLIGIVGGAAAFLFYHLYPNAFYFANPPIKVDLLKMTYFGFVTLSTLGYGDITPARPETQTLSFLLAVIGQLYLAIIIAFIVGKFIAHNPDSRKK